MAVLGLTGALGFGGRLLAALGQATPVWSMPRYGLEFSATAAPVVLGALAASGLALGLAGVAGLLRAGRPRR